MEVQSKPKKSRIQGGGWVEKSNVSKKAKTEINSNKEKVNILDNKNLNSNRSNQQNNNNKANNKIIHPQPQSKFVVHCMKSPYDVYIGRPNPKVPVAAQNCVCFFLLFLFFI